MSTRHHTLAAIAVVVLMAVLPQAGLAEVPAGSLAPALIQVPGDPTPIETLRAALLATARAMVPEARDAQVTLAQVTPPLEPLPVATGVMFRAVVQVAAT